MDRDELIEELKKCPPGKVSVTVVLTKNYYKAVHAKIEKVVTVPNAIIEASSDE